MSLANSLISLTDLADSQLFTRGLHNRLSWYDSRALRFFWDNFSACDVFNFKTFHVIARKQATEYLYRPIAAYFYLIRINYIIL